MRSLALVVSLLSIALGCQSTRPANPLPSQEAIATPSKLLTELENRGATFDNTDYFVLVGDEAWPTKPRMKIVLPDNRKTIWRSIRSSMPTDVWYASGYLKLEIYSAKTKKPITTLSINEADAVHIRDLISIDEPMRFRCLGLHAFLMRLHSRLIETNKSADGTDSGINPQTP
ncbi:hypothetical protein JYT83_01385 [bacterium AH-315-F18]|nr:hypothetical protein [bacterium AH-315-F18]